MHRRISVLALVLAAVVAVALGGSQLATARTGSPGAVSATGCQLGDKGKVKHVIYLQFDNVHFNRDNPNVPSDLEQNFNPNC